MTGRFDRVRFYTEEHEDYRPVTVDEVGPWWCTGYAFQPDRAIIVAYMRECAPCADLCGRPIDEERTESRR